MQASARPISHVNIMFNLKYVFKQQIYYVKTIKQHKILFYVVNIKAFLYIAAKIVFSFQKNN
jgi:hypothetical protein